MSIAMLVYHTKAPNSDPPWTGQGSKHNGAPWLKGLLMEIVQDLTVFHMTLTRFHRETPETQELVMSNC